MMTKADAQGGTTNAEERVDHRIPINFLAAGVNGSRIRLYRRELAADQEEHPLAITRLPHLPSSWDFSSEEADFACSPVVVMFNLPCASMEWVWRSPQNPQAIGGTFLNPPAIFVRLDLVNDPNNSFGTDSSRRINGIRSSFHEAAG
jgi:hypothetical protein